ncbi:glycosyltransferase family 2 protein [Inmirania thermothiophila]|uniref:GT2 family glycosyltransferase n=1 Tax=Inmirania thermothiophila TaxID=1750597 RepID=A0A3N1XST4_9GAMM|nr:glycosyltransferase [Inmirania thermothiophila]ROR29705.1 GT2 family glycosyltransferase [Inmirania thermothiophila]
MNATCSPLITLGVPAYDRWETLERLLNSLLAQRTDIPYEIVVGDDAHPANLHARVRATYPQVRSFRNHENRGPGHTRNRILEHARAPYVAFFDADCVVPPNWIEQVRPHLAPDLLLSGRVVRPDGTREWGPRRRTWIGVSIPCPVRWANVASSNNMVVPRDLAFRVGGFNEALGIYFEDSLFSLRCCMAGARVRYLETAFVVHHHHSARNPGRARRQAANTLWSMYHVHRHHPLRRLGSLTLLVALYGTRSLAARLRGEREAAAAWLAGITEALGWIRSRRPWREDWLHHPPC